MLASKYEFDMTTQYWVIAIFTWIRYVTLWPWPFDRGVMSRDATWVVNPCTYLELDTTCRSRLTMTTIFHWPICNAAFSDSNDGLRLRTITVSVTSGEKWWVLRRSGPWHTGLLYASLIGWRHGSVVRTSVFNWRTFPDLRLIYG